MPKTMYLARIWCRPKVITVQVERLTQSSYWEVGSPARRSRSTNYEVLCETFVEAKQVCVHHCKKEVDRHARSLGQAEERLQQALGLKQ